MDKFPICLYHLNKKNINYTSETVSSGKINSGVEKKMKHLNNLILSSFICLFLFFTVSIIPVMAWTVSPVRFEISGERGKEYTLTFSVLNESQLHQKRFEIQTDDWIIDNKNNFLRKAFTKDLNVKHSSTPWIKVTPQQFVVPPGETKNIRFTISIPKDIQEDGDYSAGLFVGEKNIEKPPKGEKIVHIKQDTYIGVIVYVNIGNSKEEVILKDLKVESISTGKVLNKVTLLPLFENTGNIHSRAQITVKAEPLSKIEIKETKSEISSKDNLNLKNTMAESMDSALEKTEQKKEFNAGELVVLRESQLAYPFDIPEPLPAGSEWKFVVQADFGKNKPILVGTKKYKIPLKTEIENQKNSEVTNKK